jgi:hypothetical protein
MVIKVASLAGHQSEVQFSQMTTRLSSQRESLWKAGVMRTPTVSRSPFKFAARVRPEQCTW